MSGISSQTIYQPWYGDHTWTFVLLTTVRCLNLIVNDIFNLRGYSPRIWQLLVFLKIITAKDEHIGPPHMCNDCAIPFLASNKMYEWKLVINEACTVTVGSLRNTFASLKVYMPWKYVASFVSETLQIIGMKNKWNIKLYHTFCCSVVFFRLSVFTVRCVY